MVPEINKHIDAEIERIEKLTYDNHHSQAHAAAANLAGHKIAYAAFSHIADLKFLDGELHDDVRALENRWREDFYKWARNQPDNEIVQRALRAL